MMRTLHFSFFFFNDTATTEIYTLSLHDALPISRSPFGHEYDRGEQEAHLRDHWLVVRKHLWLVAGISVLIPTLVAIYRSEEHTSELQSLRHLVCRLLLEKKKNSVRDYIWLAYHA